MKTGVIIVAGGSGRRMGGSVPKQFLELCGRPVLMRTIERFSHTLPEARIVIALPDSERERWKGLVAEYSFSIPHTVSRGGETRFDSVKNALAYVADCDYIGVHDGVRPLVSREVITRVLAAAQENGAAIPVTEVVDSIRQLSEDGLRSVIMERSSLRAVQTPQFFRTGILTSAYGVNYSPRFTDDSSVAEAAGYGITLVEGASSNIKITTAADLAIAEALFTRGM